MSHPIVVTGASGFLGSKIVEDLFRNGMGDRTHLLVRSELKEDSLLGLRFRDAGLSLSTLQGRLHFADLQNSLALEKALDDLSHISKAWIVVHLAAIINARGDVLAQERVNIRGTEIILDWCNHFGSHFVYSSSVVAFGAVPGSQVRDEGDYQNYHPFNRLDSYSRSKRQAHDLVLKNAKVACTLVCPGIIHGSYEHKKSSRSHLKAILEGRLRWVPGGGGSFVSLKNVSAAILTAIESEPKADQRRTQLLNDVYLPYTEYFQLYRECAGKERISIHALPHFLLYLVIVILLLIKLIGLKAPVLSKISQSLMHYRFKTGHSPDEGKRILREAICESLATRK